MNQLISKTKKVFFASQTSILTSTIILSGMILLSRIAGFIRYRILAGFFTKEELDIYFAAFRIPDLVFEILISGALSTTFIPFFVEYQRKNKDRDSIISSVINAVTLTLFVAVLILVISMPFIMPILTPGFAQETMPQLVFYARILLLGQLPFLVLGNFLTGISQAKKSFIIPAIAPIIYNIAIIVFIFMFKNSWHLMAPIFGVVFGAIVFFLIQLPVLFFAEFNYILVLRHIKEVFQFFKTAIPRIMTIIVAQIDATVDLALASLLGSGAYTIFYLAQRLQLLPVSLIGMAFGQASLPYLTEVFQQGKKEQFRIIIKQSLLNIFFFTIPASMFLVLARTPMVRLFFGGEKFDWSATNMTALTLSFFAISLPLHAAYYFLARSFYAAFDTKTPFLVTAFSILLNAILSTYFTIILKLPVWGLALSFSIAMSLRSILLTYLIFRRTHIRLIFEVVIDSLKIFLAALNTSVLTYFLIRLIDGLILDTSRTINIFALLAIGSVFYFIFYVFFCYIFGVKELSLFNGVISQFKNYKKRVFELYKGVETVE